MSQGHVRVEGEAQGPGQGPAAVTDPFLKTVTLLGAAAQSEVDHRADGPEGADLVETHIEGLRPGGHTTQVTHHVIQRLDVHSRGGKQGDVRRDDLGQRVSGGLPH